MTELAKAARAELLTRGCCTFAINHGNVVLVSGYGLGSVPQGITPELAQAIARDLGVALKMKNYDRAVDVSDGAGKGIWDICFLAVDPKRAESITFTEPYIRITGSYLVAAGSPAQTPAELEQAGLRIAATRGSAYALHLQRNSPATIVTPETFAETIAALDAGEVVAVGGVTEALQPHAIAGRRLIAPPFMAINQAIGSTREASAMAAYLADFVRRETARGGKVAQILLNHGIA